MQRTLRKYHRTLALIISLPLILTITTGMIVTMLREWSLFPDISSKIFIKIHTGEIFHLQAIYPILNGLGLIGLLATGLSMSGLGRRKPSASTKSGSPGN